MRRIPIALVLTASFVLAEHNPVSAFAFLNRKARDRPAAQQQRHEDSGVDHGHGRPWPAVAVAPLHGHVTTTTTRFDGTDPTIGGRFRHARPGLPVRTRTTTTTRGVRRDAASSSSSSSSSRPSDGVPTTTSNTLFAAPPSGDQTSLREPVPVSISGTANQHLSMMASAGSATATASRFQSNNDRGRSPGGVGTPLARFNNLVNYERYGDDLDDPNIADSSTTTLELHSKETSGGGESSEHLLPPVVSFMDLMTMAFKSATSPEMQAKRRQLVQQLKQHGGYCVVEMDRNDVEARILDNMWQLMDIVLTRGDEESEEGSPTMLRRQVLKRNFDNSTSAAAEASDNPGYDFVQTTLVDNELRPLWIEERHGPVAARRAHDAYMLLGQLCKAFATVVYSGSTGTRPGNATFLMESLLNDPYRSMSGSYHRLCKYLPLSQTSQNGGWGESLRPHVDWTLSTAIPVSDISGLEVYDPSVSRERWVRVEDLMRDDWKRAKQSSRRDVGGTGDRVDTSRQCRWNAHYVVVFAGAWLELLTDGDVESTLHRVVSQRRDASTTSSSSNHRQRLSAPFFMRPKEHVFETMNQVFDDPTNEEFADLDSRGVVREMGQFLRESELLRAERRDGEVSNSDIAGESTYR